MKRLFLMLLLLPLALCVGAQKKDIATAREYVKKGNNLEKAEQMMRKLLADSANRDNVKIWSVLFDAQRRQYENGNEKLYLKQKYDTVALFNIASRMFSDMEAFDSLASRPDSRGRVKNEWRKPHAQLLDQLRPNLLGGGLFFIRKQKYAEGYRLLDQYIDTSVQPLFQAYRYSERDKRLPEAAYWAVYCAYKMGDSKLTLHHTYLALKDTAHYEQMLQYLAETYQHEGDTARYVKTLDEGFHHYTLNPFFFSRLVDHYSSQGHWQEALGLTERALQADGKNRMFRLTKSVILLNTGRYRECYALSDSLVQDDDSLAEAWLNAGLAKFNEGVAMDKDVKASVKHRQQILDCYRQALPYLEQYRKMQPERKDRWALPLYTIYLNLNKGKEFDEIDKIIKS